MEQVSRYKWMTRIGIVLILFMAVFILKAGLNGEFHSLETFQKYINGFGITAPIILTAIQAFQVVVPVLPGFFGCIVGAVLFGSMGGFWCNYIGISAGSIIAFFLARKYGTPLVEAIFPKEKYSLWVDRLQGSRRYTWILFLSILLPLAPDDFLCYFSGLMGMSPRKFVWIIVLGKPWCILFYSVFFELFIT